jgi:hypothetical protein
MNTHSPRFSGYFTYKTGRLGNRPIIMDALWNGGIAALEQELRPQRRRADQVCAVFQRGYENYEIIVEDDYDDIFERGVRSNMERSGSFTDVANLITSRMGGPQSEESKTRLIKHEDVPPVKEKFTRVMLQLLSVSGQVLRSLPEDEMRRDIKRMLQELNTIVDAEGPQALDDVE